MLKKVLRVPLLFFVLVWPCVTDWTARARPLRIDTSDYTPAADVHRCSQPEASVTVSLGWNWYWLNIVVCLMVWKMCEDKQKSLERCCCNLSLDPFVHVWAHWARSGCVHLLYQCQKFNKPLCFCLTCTYWICFWVFSDCCLNVPINPYFYNPPVK